MSFTDKKLEEVWKDLIQCDNSNTGLSSSLKTLKTGNGDSSAVQLSTRQLAILPGRDTVGTFTVSDTDGNNIFLIDTSNDVVKAGVGQHIVNTQYAYFSIANENSKGFDANTHHPIPFVAATALDDSIQDNINFGTGTDPADTFTTADSAGTYASDLVPMLWYVPDNITIDAVYSLEGADNSTGDTTRFHLLRYDFTSGATACLTNGTLLAHNAETVNAGNEQPYKTTFTLDSANVDAGKVIMAFFRHDSDNSDYSMQVVCKYHCR